jgi:two-component system, response regulator YesN
MRALIIDDEKHAREAVRQIVPWSDLGIEEVMEAPDGPTAIIMISNARPELIFMDMDMPVMDGVEMLQWLKQHIPHAKVIIISGHYDMGYIQPAFVYGGVDYILKPISREQLKAAAERAMSAWLVEEQERKLRDQQNLQLNMLRPLYWEKKLSELAAGTCEYAEISDELEAEIGLPSLTRDCRAAIFKLQGLDQRFAARFKGDLRLISFALENVCNEMLMNDRTGYAFRRWQTGGEIIMLLWSDLRRAENKLQDIQASLKRLYGLTLHFGLSDICPFPAALRDTLEQAERALDERNLLEPHRYIHTMHAGYATRQESSTLLKYSEIFKYAVLSGSSEKIEAVVEAWEFEVRKRERITRMDVKLWQEQFADMIGRLKKELFKESTGPSQAEPGFPFMAEEAEVIKGWKAYLYINLLELSKHFRLVRQRDGQLVRDIKRYLEDNYTKEITLQQLADHFFLSRENVSRKFKLVSSENLSDYLTTLRVNKAKELLTSTEMRLSEIAGLVGFQDEKYFGRVFKKAVGKTPSEYRKA